MSERKYALLLLSLLVITVTILGCTPTPKESKNKPDRAFAPMSLSRLGMKFDMTPDMEPRGNNVSLTNGAEAVSLAPIKALSDIQNQLWVQIQSKSMKSETLVEAFLEAHQKDYMMSSDLSDSEMAEVADAQTMRAKIESLANSADLSQDNQNKLKANVEDKLEAEVGEIQYNREHASLYSLFHQNRMQCFSGTSFFEAVRQLRSDKQKKRDGSVVIFTDGHVLPGYIRRIGSSSEFELFGIETTVRGEGLVKFGPTHELESVRVVEANFFMAIEIFEDKILNPRQVLRNALVLTGSRYGIPVENIEKALTTPAVSYSGEGGEADIAGSLSENLEDRINQSLLAFGTSQDVPYGDLERQRMDEVEVPTNGGAGGKQLAIRYAHKGSVASGPVIVDPLGLGIEIQRPEDEFAEKPAMSPQLQALLREFELHATQSAGSAETSDEEDNRPVKLAQISLSRKIYDQLAEIRSVIRSKRGDDLQLFVADGHLFVLQTNSKYEGDGQGVERVFRVQEGQSPKDAQISNETFEAWVQSSLVTCFGRVQIPNSPHHPDHEPTGYKYNVSAINFEDIAILEMGSEKGFFACYGQSSSVYNAEPPFDLFEEPSVSDIAQIMGPGFVIEAREYVAEEANDLGWFPMEPVEKSVVAGNTEVVGDQQDEAKPHTHDGVLHDDHHHPQ
ncbi:MAG: hypothetical protein AAF202_02005 [Pseudomonadota bacterium]